MPFYFRVSKDSCTFSLQNATLAQQYYIILLMRAVVKEITSQCNHSQILVICNKLDPHYVETRLATKKYKKVSKAAKARLLKCIEKGWSIINVSKKFGINYSTAKSIVQNQKKKVLQVDGKVSSTESIESCEDEEYL